MNNKNKILVGCLALLLVLSVGYALFSDTITINGTATAKGEFDITATCETGIPSKLGTEESLGLQAEGGYQNDTCSVVDDVVTFKTDFLYPGARRHFVVKYTNVGTIDATYNWNDRSVSTEICVADNMNGENKECNSSTDKSSFNISYGAYAGYLSTEMVALEDPNGNLVSSEETMEFLDSETGTWTLKTGYSAYRIVTVRVSHVNQSNGYGSGEFFAEYNFSLEIPFKQAQ